MSQETTQIIHQMMNDTPQRVSQSRTSKTNANARILLYNDYRKAPVEDVLDGTIQVPTKIDDIAYVTASDAQKADLIYTNGTWHYPSGSGYHYQQCYNGTLTQ